MTATLSQMKESESVCGTLAAAQMRAAALAAAKSDLRNAALAVETWIVDHPRAKVAPDATVAPGQRGTGARAGFGTSRSNTLDLWGVPGRNGGTYCMRVTSPDLGLPEGEGLWYDSEVGGLKKDTARPTTGACGKTAPQPQPEPAPEPQPEPGTVAASKVGSGTAPITDAEVAQFIRGDLAANVDLITGYQQDHDGNAPAWHWVRPRIQHTGFNHVYYTKVDRGRFCLSAGNFAADSADRVWWAGTGIDGIQQASGAKMFKAKNACGQMMRAQRQAAIQASMKATAKNAALTVETWLTDHPNAKVPHAKAKHSKFKPGKAKPNKQGKGVLDWFHPSPGTTVEVWPGAARGTYCIQVTNKNAGFQPGHGIIYKSGTRGIKPGRCHGSRC